MLIGKLGEGAMRTKKTFWRVVGYDDVRPFYQKILPAMDLSDIQMILLLQRLVSRHLTDDEIVACSRKSGTVGYSPFLNPLIGSRANLAERFVISVGGKTHYKASIWTSDELAPKAAAPNYA